VKYDTTTPASDKKARDPTTCWLARFMEAVGQHLFAAEDRAAIQYGWQITACHGGLGRRYRDARFDTLRVCPRCEGSGGIRPESCAPCEGTGRVTRVASRREGRLR
jgi:hypothetical protein